MDLTYDEDHSDCTPCNASPFWVRGNEDPSDFKKGFPGTRKDLDSATKSRQLFVFEIFLAVHLDILHHSLRAVKFSKSTLFDIRERRTKGLNCAVENG
jgi:hypothetical protein